MIGPQDNTTGQNRAVGLREHTVTGESARRLYEIIKDSEFLTRRPELRGRLSRAFGEKEPKP